MNLGKFREEVAAVYIRLSDLLVSQFYPILSLFAKADTKKSTNSWTVTLSIPALQPIVGQFGTRTIWHQDNSALDNLATT